MEYSDDIVERVRAALMDFHAATGSQGRKRSWKEIAIALHDEFLELPADDDESLKDIDKPLAEALRRFAAGTQTPSKERLDALCAYLKANAYLSAGDLQPAEPGGPLIQALREFFGAPQEPLPVKAGSFEASRKLAKGRTELSLLTIRETGKAVMAVEDKVYRLAIPPQSTRRDALLRLAKRTGGSEARYDGWLFHAPGQLCLFLQDSLREGASIYTVLDRRIETALSPARMVLLKSHEFGPPLPGDQPFTITSAVTMNESTLARIRDNLWEYRERTGHGD